MKWSTMHKRAQKKVFQIGSTVKFIDEFGVQQVGKIITFDAFSLNQFSKGPHVRINTPDGSDCYVRSRKEIKAVK